MLHLGKAQDRTGSLVSHGTLRDARSPLAPPFGRRLANAALSTQIFL
ncbi:MAG: hypothetical protein V7L29_09245 [Nostoc sp.]